VPIEVIMRHQFLERHVDLGSKFSPFGSHHYSTSFAWEKDFFLR